MRKATRKRPGPRTYLGLAVSDAKRPLHFVVSDGDCRLAKKKLHSVARKEREDVWPECCAAANAIRRVDPDVIRVRVHRSVIMVIYEDRAVRYHTPHALRDQIIRLDGPSRSFEPGAYSALPVAPSTIKSRGMRHTPTNLKRGDPNSKKRRRPPHELGRVKLNYAAA